MGRYFSVIVILAFIVLGGGYLWHQKSEEAARERVAADLQTARRAFAEKARSAAEEDDDDRYLRSVQAAIRAYDEELNKRVYAKRPEWRDPGAYPVELDKLLQKEQIKDGQHVSMMEGYRLVREAYDLIMAANWKPVLTKKGKGGTRLDIYSLKRIEGEGGPPMLEGTFLFWGIEDSTRVSWGQLSLRFWRTESQEVREGGRRVTKDVETVLGKAEGEAQPHYIIQTPHKYVKDFPAYVSIGTLRLPVMPHEASAVDISYRYTAKIGGGSYDTDLSFEKLAIPEAWKLKPGETWDADVVEATEEEITGRQAE